MSGQVRPDTFACRAARMNDAEAIAIAFGDGAGTEEKCPDVLYEWRPEP